MKSDIRDILDEFVQEAEEQLGAVEALLMEMEVARVAGRPLVRSQLDTVFRAFHSVKGTAGFLELDQIVAVTHEAETILDRVRQEKTTLTADMVTALCSALDFTNEALRRIAAYGSDTTMLDEAKALVQELRHHDGAPGVVIAERGTPPTPVKAEVPFPLDEDEGAPPLPSLVIDEEPAEAPTPPKAAPLPDPDVRPPVPPETTEERREERQDEAGKSGTIRVDVAKLDALMNLVGELILAETMVTQSEDLRGLPLPSFTKSARALNRITRALQDIAMSVRMVPIGGVFQRMHRLVRDVSRKQGKKVTLALRGEGTEIDKNLVERIGDPLVHMMRNGVDHGIETPEERTRCGKDPTGTITLEALHQSGEVWIVVQDDGRGLHRDKILARAVERGLVPAGVDLSDSDVFNLIFAPGFSTAETLSDISGRGVGMDVVRRNIEEVGGRVEVSSVPGAGTKVTLKIPLTLAIIDGMLVRVGAHHYTLPVLSIHESLRGAGLRVTCLPDGREMVNLRGQVVPLLRLSTVFDGAPARRDVQDGIVVLCSHAGKPVCLLVDELVGQRQTVIKALPSWLGSKSCFAGCSILSNGDISLIIDLGHVVARPQQLRAA